MMKDILIWAILAVNIVTFALYGIDKAAAIYNGKLGNAHGMDSHDSRLNQYGKKSRIPRSVLMIFSACFGSVGALFGMELFCHKVRYEGKNACFAWVALICVGHVALLMVARHYGVL